MILLWQLWVTGLSEPAMLLGPHGSRAGDTMDSPRFRHSQAAGSSDQVLISLPAPQSVPSPSEQGCRGKGEDQDEGCSFPMVGRVDPRSNFVPAHFLRYLLSLVGANLVASLGAEAVEVARLREVARTFRYRVASAYERALGAGMLFRGVKDPRDPQRGLEGAQEGLEAGEREDEDIDAVRHVFREEYDDGTDLALWGQQLYLGGESSVGTESSSELGDSTATPEGSCSSVGHPSSQEVQGASVGAGTRGGGMEEFQIPDASEGVRYRPEDGALIVLYGDYELRVELPGWTLEEVTSIVTSIRNDDWSAFHEVMALGGVQGMSVQGSSMGFSYGQSSQEEGQLGSPNSDLRSRKGVQEGSLQALGEDLGHLPFDYVWNFSLWVVWMVWSFFACLGAGVTGCWVFGGTSPFAVDQVFGYGIALLWILSVLHRVWIVVVSPGHVGTQRVLETVFY